MRMGNIFAFTPSFERTDSTAEKGSTLTSSNTMSPNSSSSSALASPTQGPIADTAKCGGRMTRLAWYKRDVRAALDGMLMLTLEERGAYNTVLDLIYMTGDNLIDDDRFICGWLRCDLRVWKRLKAGLIHKEKLTISSGIIRNVRASYEVQSAAAKNEATSSIRRTSGIKSGEARRKINHLAEQTLNKPKNTEITIETIRENRDRPLDTPNVDPLLTTGFEENQTLTRTDIDIERKRREERDIPPNPPSAKPAEPESDRKAVEVCITAWNNLASETGLTRVQLISDSRRTKLKARLKEIGGLEGWFALCDRIRQSGFLKGQTSDWRVSFDWCLSPTNCTKIMEGNYDDRRDAPSKNRRSAASLEMADERARILASLRDPEE